MAFGPRLFAILVAATLLAPACDDPPQIIESPEVDAGGIECTLGQVARFGVCLCQNDTGCATTEYCDAVTGQCRPRDIKPGPDAGPVGCTTGARRCRPVTTTPDAGPAEHAIEECQAGVWTDLETCPADGVCTAAADGYYCTKCSNGQTRCKDETTLETCNEKGDDWIVSTCPVDPITGAPSKCEFGRCQRCTPGAQRCSTNGTSLETCEADGSGWSSLFCTPTGKCELLPVEGADAGAPLLPKCVPPVCNPRSKRCKQGSATVLETCRQDGLGWDEADCKTLDEWATPEAVCQNNDCLDPCANAARQSSYQGCEYWAAVTPNIPGSTATDTKAFTGGLTTFDTQPETTSEYAVVISNSNLAPAKVRITRRKGGVESSSPSLPAADAAGVITVAAQSLQIVRLPWQMMESTGKQPYAYHVVSNLPVSAYQFSPVTSKVGSSYSYTNDASLLLPAHILANQYVVIAQEHITVESDGIFGTNSMDYPAFFSMLATQDNTVVTIRFGAATVAEGGIAAQAIGSQRTYTLNRFDVLQFLSATGGTKVCTETPGYALNGISRMCKWTSDPTGSIVSSDKPIAVFGGALCTFKPHDKMACDHIEEQMMPFNTWGKSYAGAKTVAYRTSSGPVANQHPDFWRVVAGCGKASCPAGTRFTINPAPTQIMQTQYCQGGVCTLPPIDPAGTVTTATWLEFTHSSDFTVTSEQPVMLAQYFTGEDANAGSVEGDPALILTPPIEQWRTTYNVLASPTLVHNYLSMVTQSATPGITIDGRNLTTSNFPGMQTSLVPGGSVVYRVPVTGGSHQITSNAKLGVTIYGYDSYVSYGYTGGLDLTRITTIDPGG
ncbi:MAG: IgGFc-binding protein [Deltaproteobacteria bacterium]|nr:IgGFc-binding protein [Deltaproteobacteria bacterium]